MLFNSLEFFVFVAVVLALYHLVPRRLQKALLLAASVVFYLSWDYRFLALLGWSIVVDYAVSIWMSGAPDKRRNRLLIAGLANNLTMLAVFKYFNFFVDSAVSFLAGVGVHASEPTVQLLLPVGISFYTFHTMSYTIDVWRRRIEPEHNFITFALYVSFFPQLAAGPISRGAQMLPQLNRDRHVTADDVREGAWLIFRGLFKKVVIADNLAIAANNAFSVTHPTSGVTALFGIYAFAFQIYCDFSGYSDMARGLAKLFGLELMVNFNRPYLATNPSDFWQRWHISLSTWLRDYLYVPLGGNREGERRTYLNLMVTMALGGLWHGASWTFVLWGVFHGTLLMGHRALAQRRPERAVTTVRLFAKRFAMFQLVGFGWLIFRASGVDQVGGFLSAITRDFTPEVSGASVIFSVLLFVAILVAIEMWNKEKDDPREALGWNTPVGPAAVTTLALVLLLAAPATSQQFIYFQF